MKKTAIALLAISALGTAFAETAFTPYVTIDIGASSTQTTGANDTGLVFKDSVNQTSLLGIKANTDIGDGLKGFLHIEEAISANGSASGGLNGLASRVGKVGLSGAFGTVAIGAQWGPYDNSAGYGDSQGYNKFSAYSTVLNSGAHWDNGNGGASGQTTGSIQYTSPAMNGLTFEANYAPAKVSDAAGTANAVDLSSYGFNVVYTGAALTVTGAMDRTPTRYSNVCYTACATSMGYANAWKLEGAYNLGAASVYAAFIGATVDQTKLGSDRDSGYVVGVKVPKDKWTFALGAGSVKTSGDDMNQTVNTFAAQALYAYNKNAKFYVGAKTATTNPVAAAASTTTNLGAGLVLSF